MNDDCVLCVLAKLGVCDLVNCLLVSKRFNTIVKNNLIWSILFKEKFYNFKFVEGNDFYEIQIWRSSCANLQVIKQWE